MNQVANCKTDCRFYYDSGYSTPVVYRETQAVSSGDNYHMYGYLRGYQLPNFNLRFGNATCDFSEELYAEVPGIEDAPELDVNDGAFSGRWLNTAAWWMCAAPNTPAGKSQRNLRVDIPENRGGGAAIFGAAIGQVDIATDMPYDVVVVPRVSSMTWHVSGVNGGSSVVLTGTGFDESDLTHNDVSLAGSPCAVTAVTDTTITCTVGAAPASTDTTSRFVPGTRGLTTTVFEASSFSGKNRTYTQVDSLVSAFTRSLVPTSNTVRESWSQVWEGYFVPPTTGDYQFTVFSDDAGRVYLSTDDSAENAELIAERWGTNGSLAEQQIGAIRTGQAVKPVSAVKALTAGQMYYFKAEHSDGSSTDFFYGGVRMLNAISDPVANKNARAARSLAEVWTVDVDSDVVREQAEITVLGMKSASTFKFRKSTATRFDEDANTVTGDSSTGTIARELRLATGCNSISVSKTTIPGPAAGTDETKAQAAARLAQVGWKWTATLHCPATTPQGGTHPNIAIVALNTLPQSVAVSGDAAFAASTSANWVRTRSPSQPLSGDFTVVGPAGTSNPIAIGASTGTIADAIRQVYGWTGPEDDSSISIASTGNSEDSRALIITIQRPVGNIATPTFNGAGITGAGARLGFSTLWQGNANTYEYPSIPMEFFRTIIDRDSNADGVVSTPVGPVEVTVNSVSAVCDTFNYVEGGSAGCTFNYDASITPTVSAVTPTSGTVGTQVTITGTGLPSAAADATVTIGKATCAIDTISSTSITCTIGDGAAGQFDVVVLVAGGVGTATTTAQFTLQQVITSIAPAAGSVAGGTLLTITGTGFQGETGDAVFLSANAASTAAADACVVQSATHTQIICRTQAGPSFVARRALRTAGAVARDLLSTTPVNVLVNTAAAPTQFTYDANITPTITGLTPSSLSTAITGQITLTTNIAAGTDVSVTVGDRKCVDQTTTTGTAGLDITCWLRRGPPATDTMLAPKIMVGPNVGYADHDGNKLDTAFEVTAISLTSGSLLGGSEVTVTGKGFANRANTNEALIVVSGAGWSTQRGRFTSDIVSYSDTSIVFRVPPVVVPDHAVDSVTRNGDGDVTSVSAAITMRTNRIEADCKVAGGCNWEWSAAATGACTGVTLSGRNAVIEGTALAGVQEVQVGGQACSVTANTATSVTCALPALTMGEHGVTVRTASGFAECSEQAVEYTLQVDSVSPVNGTAAGGATVTIRGWGFETVSRGNTVRFGSATAIVRSSSADQLVVTTPATATAGVATVTVMTQLADGSAVDSATGGPFTFLTANAAITAVTPATGVVANTQLTLTGAGLGTVAGTVTLGGALCAVDSWTASQILCTMSAPVAGTFTPDVQLPNNAGRAYVGVTNTAGTLTYNVAVTVPLSVTSVTTAGPVGLGGGAEITIAGSGFSSVATAPMENPSGSAKPAACSAFPSKVTVCGVPAKVTASTGTQLTVAAPSVATPAAVQNLKAWEEVSLDIQPENFIGNDLAQTALAFDSDLGNGLNAGTDDSCYVGVDFGEYRRALVTRIRWYATWRAFNAPQEGKFQGSVDGSTWVDIATITERPTEGWNVINVVGAGGIFPEHHDLSTLSAFRSLRFFAPTGSGAACRFNEVQFIGYDVNAAATAGNCPVTVAPDAACGTWEDVTAPLPVAATAEAPAGQTVAVSVAATPKVDSVSPDNAPSLGGATVTLFGSGFGTVVGDVTVMLNEVECTVTAVTNTAVTCTTNARPLDRLAEPSIVVTVAGKGLAVVPPLVRFKYLDRWSSVTSWMFQEIPSPGDSVTIPPGQALLLDTNVDLFLLLVQGELIWDTTQDGLTLDATYIFVHGGRFEIGREGAPMMNHATVTLHGDRYKNMELPRIGAKVLAVTDRAGSDSRHGAAISTAAQGFLDIHGPQLRRAWTMLKKDAHSLKGTNEFELAEPVDWPVGSTVVLPSTGTNFQQAEEVVIDAVLSPTRYRIQGVFKYDHRADVFPAEVYGHSDFDMRGEVGLLTRKVVIQGDDWSNAQHFGVHTIAMGGGTYRISHTEVRNCGQSFLLGRYCTHGHLAGEFSRSYVQSNSIHHSFQRITTIHGVRHFVVKHNFGYHVKGHSIFVEDGVEEFNQIEENLVAVTLRCTACLKSDIKPASFWTASPRQFWRHNRAAGSVNDGYWLELPGNPHGPSFTTTVCPVHEKLGGFFNNTAHSNGVHGLRLYPVVLPYENPCADRPNPFAIRFYNFTSFRNGQHGIFGKKNGDLHHINAKLGENSGSDQFWTKLEKVKYHENDPNILNGLFVGRVNGVTDTTDLGKAGLWAPQNEFFHVKDTTFVNYGASGALRGCAKCGDQTSLKQGAYTVRTQGLTFVNTAKKVKFTEPHKQIFYDLDGTLSGVGVQSWLTAPFKFNEYAPACVYGDAITHDGGIVCDNSVEVRRIQIDGYNPVDLRGRTLMVTPREDTDINAMIDAQQDRVTFLYKEIAGWVFPLVTRRWVHFKIDTIMDWETLQMRYSEPDYVGTHSLNPAGAAEWVGLSTNWISYRWRNKVLYGKSVNDYFGADMGSPNMTEIMPMGGIDEFPDMPTRYPESTDLFGTGYIPQITNGANKTWFGMFNNVFNESAGQPWDADVARFGTHRVQLKNIQCRPNALPGDIGYCAAPGASAISQLTKWSDPNTWAHMNEQWQTTVNRLPQDGDDVIIPETMGVLLDIAVTPLIAKLQVYGRLEFDPTLEVTLNVRNFAVVAPTASPDLKGLYIGTEKAPRQRPATINFHGKRSDDPLIVDNSQFLDNKVLGIFANVSVHGMPVATPWTKIAATAAVGATSVELVTKTNWQVGWEIVIAPTGSASQSETVTITAVDNSGANTVLTFAPALEFEHFSAVQQMDGESIELRAAVGVLTRNIKFVGIIDENADATSEVDDPSNRHPDLYGFHLHVGEFNRRFEASDTPTGDAQTLQYIGMLDVSNVQFVNGGPAGMQHAVVGFNYRYRDGSETDDLMDTVTNDDLPVNAIKSCGFQSSWNRIVRVEGDVPGLVIEDNVIDSAHDSAIFFARKGSDGARINRNLVAGVQREIDAPEANWVYPFSGIYMFGRPHSMEGNVVAGSEDQGMTFRPEFCVNGDDRSAANAVITDNEVVGAVIGMFMIGAHVSERVHCQRLVNAKVWRTSHMGIFTTDQTSHMLLDRVTVTDSHIGIALNYFRSATKSYSWLQNSVIVGSSAAGDCSPCRAATQADANAMGCNSVVSDNHRVGILVPQYTNRAKTCFSDVTSLLPVEACWPPTLPERLCNMPWEQRHGLMSTRHQEMIITNTKLLNFKSNSCGKKDYGIRFNPTQSESAVPITIEGASWVGTDNEAKLSLALGSDTAGKCRDRGCDSFQYMTLTDKDGTSFDPEFNRPNLVIPRASYTVGETCSSMPAWGNVLVCTSEKMVATRAFVAESLDRDRGFRRLEPISMSRPVVGSPVNAEYGAHGPLSDNCAKRFYFGQFHQVIAPSEGITTMNVTGTMPGRWRMHWYESDPSKSFVLGLHIRRPFAMSVYVGSRLVAPITTIDTLPTVNSPVGTNVFIPQALTMFITFRGSPNFEPITIVRSALVQLDLTLAMSVDEFYGSNVVNNIAILLNIDPDRIQVADVQAASAKASLTLRPASGRVQSGAPSKGPDSRAGDSGADLEGDCGVFANGTLNPATCPKTDDTSYDADVTELWTNIDKIKASMDEGTFSKSIGAEVLSLEVSAPPRNLEEESSGNADGVLVLTERQAGEKDTALSALAIGLISAACVLAVVAVVGGFLIYRRTRGAHVRGVVRGGAKGRRRVKNESPSSSQDIQLQALSHHSNIMRQSNSYAAGSPSVLGANGTVRAKRGSAYAKRVASAIGAKVASAPTSVRRLQQNHRGEKTEYTFAA